MGENKHIKELDAFAKKYIKEIPQSKVSDTFTNTLMDKLLVETKTSTIKNTPLISKKVWFLLSVVFTALLFYPFTSSKESSLQLPKFEFSFLDKIQIPNLLESFTITNITLYAFLFFGLMVIIQIGFLKNYFDKRIS